MFLKDNSPKKVPTRFHGTAYSLKKNIVKILNKFQGFGAPRIFVNVCTNKPQQRVLCKVDTVLTWRLQF